MSIDCCQTDPCSKCIKVGKWIKCSERLPEPEEWVLTIDKDNRQTIAQYYSYLQSGDLNWYDNSCCNSKVYDVTHWMPLPQAPE